MKESELWRRQADRDLAAARALLENGLNGHAAFHVQQAVEKALKSLTIARNEPLLRTHDLIILAERSGLAWGPGERNQLEELNVLYTNSRYPGEWGLLPEGQPGSAQVRDYLALAERVLAMLTPQG